MVNLFKSVFPEDMFSDIHYVDENPISINIISLYKKDGILRTDETKKTFILNTLINDELVDSFFDTLNYQWHPDIIDYFDKGIFSKLFKLFKIKDSEKIVNLITDSDWAIVTPSILDEIKKTNLFKEDFSNTVIENVGSIQGTQIYLIPEDIIEKYNCVNTIYTGYRKSITPVIHRTEKSYVFSVNENPCIKKIILK
jgi:hypothetical protein